MRCYYDRIITREGFLHLFFLEPLLYALSVGEAAAVVGVIAFRKKDFK